MGEPIVYIDHSVIRDGNLANVRTAVSALVAFVEACEPRLLSYGFHIDADTSEMAVVAVHPDSESLQYHLEIGGPEFRKVGQHIDLRRIEVYGTPSAAVLAMLRQKADMLGREARVAVHPRSVGFARLRPAES